MNPFQLSPFPKPTRSPRSAEPAQSAARMARLQADLSALAADLDIGGWSSATIVQTPNRLQVASKGTGEAIMPLLAAALLADIERTMVAAEQVRARMSPDWREKLLG